MKSKSKNDVFELGTIIKEALPQAMITYCQNFDDFYHGWDICPQPGILIRLNVQMDNCMRIKIDKYTIITYNGTCQTKQMYRGTIPASDEIEPDFDFVKKLLVNWSCIG